MAARERTDHKEDEPVSEMPLSQADFERMMKENSDSD